MIAALGDFDVSGMARRREDAFSEIVIQVRAGGKLLGFEPFAESGDLFEFVGAENSIDIGNVLLNIGAKPFDKAAGDHQTLGFARLLVFGHLEDGIDGLLFGRINEAAGVDYDDVGVGGLRREFVTSRDELAHHDLCVNKVLRAAETYKSDFQEGVDSVCRKRWLRAKINFKDSIGKRIEAFVQLQLDFNHFQSKLYI